MGTVVWFLVVFACVVAERPKGGDSRADPSADDTACAAIWYADADGDGHGDEDRSVSACAAPEGHVGEGDDCDDADGATHPGASERCDARDNDCDGELDEDPTDGAVYYPDADRDGYGAPSGDTRTACAAAEGWSSNPDDCDDAEASTSPAALEVCGDGADNNCDGDAPGCFAGRLTDADADATLTGTGYADNFGRDAAAGDLTGDGRDDLLVVSVGARPYTVFVFEGPIASGTSADAFATFSGYFDAPRSTVRPAAWADRDLDGDGQDDLVLWTDPQGSLAVGLGPFVAGASSTSLDRRLSGTTVRDAGLGDVDGDGADEVLLSTSEGGVFGYRFGDPRYVGTTDPGDPGSGYAWTLTDADHFADLATGGDVNGDGLDDLVVRMDTSSTVHAFDALRDTMTLDDAASAITVPNANTRLTIVEDLDADGLDELLLSLDYEDGRAPEVHVFSDPYTSGDASDAGTFTATFLATEVTRGLQRPMSADVDGDGTNDLFLGCRDDDAAESWVFFGPFGGTYYPERDADVTFVDPNPTRSEYSYELALPVGDALGTGNLTALFAVNAESDTSARGTVWLFDVAPNP